MSRDQIAAHKLPHEFFKPILPSPRYVMVDEIEANPDGTPKLERQLFMLDCRLSEDDIKNRYPSLYAYLETGKPAVSERYLCHSRSPWYSQENRPPAPIVCTYMRRDLSRGRPIRFILNRSQATAANVYPMLYPKPNLARAFERDPEIVRKIWAYLNDIDISSLLGEGRVYGGGLYKMEPKELGNVPADAIAALLPDETCQPRRAVQETLWPLDQVWEKRSLYP